MDVFVAKAEEVIENLDDDQWALLSSDLVTVAPYSQVNGLRPGNTVVLRTDVGNLDEDGHWTLEARNHVFDVSILCSGLPVDPDDPGTLGRLYWDNLPGEIKKAVESLVDALKQEDSEGIEKGCYSLVAFLGNHCPPNISHDNWSHFVDAIQEGIDSRRRYGQSVLVTPRDAVPRLPLPLVTNTRFNISDEHDERSLSGTSLGLTDHGEDTAEWSTCILGAVGITKHLAHVVSSAARFHDIGKSDPRFQRWLDIDQIYENPVAKSNVPRSQWGRNRVAAGWPRGGRHEELSRRLVHAWLSLSDQNYDLNDGDLLQHLVVSHHGYGRPFIIPVEDHSCAPQLTYNLNEIPVTVNPDLAVADWTQPSRFATLNNRYGPWGLALLESIVRQADHSASQTGAILEIR